MEVRFIDRDRLTLRLHEFRSEPNFVSQATLILANPATRQMLDVLRNESPSHQAFPPETPPHIRAHQQSVIEGYHLCLNNIESMATLEQPVPELVAEFKPETEE